MTREVKGCFEFLLFGLVYGEHGFACLHYELTEMDVDFRTWVIEAGRLAMEQKIKIPLHGLGPITISPLIYKLELKLSNLDLSNWAAPLLDLDIRYCWKTCGVTRYSSGLPPWSTELGVRRSGVQK